MTNIPHNNTTSPILAVAADLELRETPYGSVDYQATLQLRHGVLREPLGLDLWQEDLSAETDQRHFSIWQQPGNTLLACVVIVPLSNRRVKLRQMAVNPDFRRQRLGQKLITEVESILRNEGVGLIQLHARVSAEAFYKASGFYTIGEVFTEISIEHLRMEKVVTKALTPVITARH